MANNYYINIFYIFYQVNQQKAHHYIYYQLSSGYQGKKPTKKKKKMSSFSKSYNKIADKYHLYIYCTRWKNCIIPLCEKPFGRKNSYTIPGVEKPPKEGGGVYQKVKTRRNVFSFLRFSVINNKGCISEGKKNGECLCCDSTSVINK